jgi:undecaprenyl diphosphate synthase
MIQHVAIIMDGNGRWATERGLTRPEGHRAGAKQISVVADAARKMGIKYMTIYAFSTENWKRPQTEVAALMSLLKEFSTMEIDKMMENNVRLCTSGRTEDVPVFAKKALLDAIEKTKNNDGFTINVAFSYGGRAEIVDAVNKILKERKSDEPVTEEEFSKYLYHPEIPDPELMIRTGGELRISNFLLWQLSYAELYVTPVYWPDFGEADLQKAIETFAGRDRRFGGLNQPQTGDSVDK